MIAKRINFNGREVYNRDKQGKFSSFKTKVAIGVRKLYRATVGTLSGLAVIYVACLAWSYYSPNIVMAEKIVEVQSTELPPVMQRIAKCESQNAHVWNGQVALHANKDGSVDIGLWQINNKAWGKKASELGYNLISEEGNTAMALWIYKNRGTGDWYSSASCWNK